MYYVKKENLVQVDRGNQGEIITTDEFGKQQVVTEDEFYSEYVGVRKLKKTRTKSKSPFELAYIEQLANFKLESNEESQDYINSMKSLVQNKPF